MGLIKKKSLSLIELAIVILLVALAGAIASLRGGQFLDSFKLNREKRALKNYFNACQLIADLSSQKVELQMIKTSKKKLKLYSPQLKISKTFTVISQDEPSIDILFYPCSGRLSKSLKFNNLKSSFYLEFSNKTNSFDIVIK